MVKTELQGRLVEMFLVTLIVTSVFSGFFPISTAAPPPSGDWTISGTESYSDQEIILHGNLNILSDASLTLTNVTLIMNGTADGQRTITIQQWGSLYTTGSNITGNYYYNFRNYGYLNMQNCSVNKANSIYFYDSSDDSSVISNSTIMNTASYGIYANYASPTIINNTISSSGSHGIYAYYAAPNIISNNISGSGGSYGIYARYYSSPNIIDNNISGYNYGIRAYQYSSPTISGNTISDSNNYGIYLDYYSSPTIENNTIKNNNGGIYIYRYSSPTIINTIIDENGPYGVYAVSSYTIEIIGCTITNQTYGIRTDSQSVTVENSSISSTSYDYYLSGSVYLKSSNTSFNKSRVYVSGGVLDVYWHDTVTVEYDYLPVNDSLVEVFDNANSIVTSGVTDDSGQVKLAIKEFTQGPATMLNYTPHILKATKSGYPTGSIQSNVTCTKSDTIVLGEEVYIPGQPIVIFGDWIINNSVSHSNKTIIVDNGNVIIENGGSLSLNNTLLQLRYTTTGYRIEVQDGGSLFLYDTDVTASYPELNIYYNFRNYGYLNMQNCSVNKANSIYFYDTSDDSSVIGNSTIMNTASYGIYASQASPTIINNTICGSGSYGVYAYYSSPNIINNNISGSGGSYGIYARYYSSPNIIDNNISGYNYGIRAYQYSSPTISGNTISDSNNYGIYLDYYSSPTIENNTIKNNNGGIYSYRYSSPTIINTIIDENGPYGVYAVSSYTIEIIGCTITNQTYGIRTDSQSVTVENSSISSTNYDYYLSGSVYLKSSNTSFNKSRVYVSGGVLDVYWHDTVTVEYDYLPVNDSLVEVFDNANSIVTSGVTDDSGQVKLAIKEFTQGPATMLNYTPHILKATKSGYPTGSIQSNVTCTKSDTIVLGEEVYIPGQPIVIFGDWIINDTVSYSNKTIIVDNGNVIVENGGSLSLNNTLLQLRYTTTGYRIEVQDGGSLFLYDSNVAPSYPELDLYFNFRNYGYLNMQNCSVNKANSIYFYDSSDDSSVIGNSTIKNTASYGIYASQASPTIINNTICGSGSYGVYAYYSSPNIINNNISGSGGSYGIYARYYSSPNIIDNNISGYNYGIRAYQYSSPTISGNTISDSNNYGIYLDYYSSPTIENNTIKNNNGGIYSYRYSSPTIINTIIDENGPYGVYAVSSYTIEIIGCTITNQTYGIRTDSQSVTVENSSISSTNYDYYLSGSVYLKSSNTSFNKSRVYVSGGVLDVYWHDTVTVEYDYLPVNDSLVEVFDNANSIVTSGVTDDSGQVKLAIKEFTQGPATMLNYTPHILKATKSGYPTGSIQSNVTCTKSDTIVLGEEVYIPGQPIVIFGDWIINDTVSYSNKTIIVDNGNVIVENGGSLSLNNTLLQLRYTTTGYRIEVQDGGSLFLYDSNVAPSYPELDLYFNFRNYGYLNMQNCSVNKANSIYFYDSSDDSSVIGNSTIKNTASYGIYASQASPTIINNTICGSGSYGVYAYYSSPNIINNNISGSGGSYGIYARYYSSPNIIDNNISGYNYGIRAYQYSSPTISGNTISDSNNYGIYLDYYSSPTIENNTIKNNNGGIYSYRYSSPTIINTIIDENGPYGVYAVSSYTIEIIGCTITNQTYGIRTDSQSVTVENSSISSTNYDYYLSGSVYLKSSNTSFNKSRVYVSGGVLDVYWHDTVTVEYDYLPVNDSLVEVFDNANSIVTSGVTDDSGQVKLAIKEFTQGPATMLNYTPHILKATKSGYPTGSIQSNVTCTKSDTIVLGEEVYIPGQPIVIFGDWIINDTVSYSNKTIIVDNGNVIVENGGSLSLNNTLLQLRYTTSAGYRIEIQDGGSLFLYDSNVAPSYPELDLYFNFRNYGYLNMQNCSVNKANSIYFYDSSDDSSVICNSTIKNTASYGIYADHASPNIQNNFILRSGSYGLNIRYSSPKISGNFLKYTGGGIRTYYSDITVSNTTIIHSTSNYDYYIYWGSVKSLNTSFDESKVYFYGSGSVLDYSWYLDVNVLDANTNPISDANVSVKDSAGLQIFNGSTDAEGWVRNIVATEYRQTSAGKTYYNPHKISAEFNGTSNYVTSNIDTNKEVTVFLAVNQPLKITILAPANNSLFVQGDQIAFKALGFDPLEGILTGSAINWTSSIDGFIGSGELFSNSNLSAAVHQITAEATNSGGSSLTDSVSIELIGRADLTAENINWTPTEINEGEFVLFNASVRNVGDGYTPAPFYVRFYIDEDYLGQTQIARLNASELRIVTQTWLATASARNVTVVADYYNSIQEIDELNNRLTAPLTEINQSDLTVTGLSYTPNIFYDGTPVTFDAKIRNIGVSNANKSFDVGFYVNGTKIGTGSVDSLVAGASVNVSSNWTAVPGTYELSVKADDTNTIFESNESNNILILNLPVVEQSDLTVSNITWTPSNFTEGQVVTFDAVIANIGIGNTTRGFYTRFLIDDVNIGEKSVAGLDSGNSTTVTQTWTATSGEHTLKAVVDVYDTVAESNETNNWLSKNISQVQTDYLLFLSSNAESYTEGGNATFSVRASRKSSPGVYLSDTEVNLTLAILAENGSVIFTSPMSYANTVFSVNVSLTSYSKGNYTARVTLKDTEGVTVEESLSFKIVANFSVSVSTDKMIYDRDEIVHITGNAQYTDGTPVSNAPLILNIHVKGYTRSYSLVTGTAGNFSHHHNPSFMEAGNVTAEASVVSEKLQRSAQTSYTMYGLYMNPSGVIDCWMSKNSSENLTFSLRNYGESDLNGIAVNIIDEDTGDGVDTVLLQPPPATLIPDEEQEFTLNLIAGNVATSQANFSVAVTSTEGSTEEADLFIHLVEAVPIAIVNPTAIEAGMNPDDLLVWTVNITNSGYESMNNINISLPSLDWISVTATDLGSIAPGTGKSFDIILHPNDTAPGVYQETVTITSSNHQPVNIYLSITVTSSQQGDLMFHVINDIGENISGASIVIQNQDVLTQVFQGTTNETGYYLFDLISEGRYNYIVQASGHTSVRNSTLVAPGVQTLVEPVLPKSILGVLLTVTQIQIGDEYDIVLNLTFETDVPPPVLIPNPLYIRYGVNFNDPVYDTDGNITISNPGLISIFNVTVDSSLLAGVDITFPTGETFFVGELKANSSVTIPYHLHVTSVSCDSDHYRNSIRLRGDYIYFEEYSDVTHNVYLSSAIPVFIYMYNCPGGGGGDPIEKVVGHFTYHYYPPGGSYSPGVSLPRPIREVETVHERVKFSLSQDATLERDAFAAGLELTNKLTDKNIEGVKVVIDITDELGSDAADMFYVNQTFLININAIDGTGVINPAAVANIDWLLVPKPGAGGTDPAGQDYSVQAFIDYTVDGAPFCVNSTEERINVMPQPLLNLTYMVPREVKADTPFNITLNVTNVGYGIARNLRFDSAQPVIYENKAGLLVAFELIGSGIVGEAESDTMLIKFGDIAPGESKTGYWIMTASLDGEFTELRGSFSHSNAVGGAETSLIRNITYIIPGSVHNINKGSSFASIQAAINDADPGDELHVDSGIYYENVVVNKQLILRGIDIGGGKPVVNAKWNGTAITISADGVLFDGFVVTGAQTKAIEILSDGNTIMNNNISSNPRWGLYLTNSSNNEIVDNIVNNNYYGIILSSSSNNTIYHNKLINNYDYAFDNSLNQWDNGVEGNYYSDYAGLDVDRNGIGDDPYPIAGGSNVDRYPLYIPLPNKPPVAIFTYLPTDLILIDEEVTFNASSSYDPYGPYDGGEIDSYEWDFGDGTTATGTIVSHTYSTLGDYEVTLALADDDGDITENSEIIQVSSVLTEDISLTVSETQKRLDEIMAEAKWSAEDGDYFAKKLTVDQISMVWDVVLGCISPVMVLGGWSTSLEWHVDPSYTYEPYKHIDSIAKYIYSYAKDELLWTDLPDYSLHYFGLLLEGENALQNNFIPPLDNEVNRYKNELSNKELSVLNNISGLTQDEMETYQEDLSKRRLANFIIANKIERNAIMLHESQNYREDADKDLLGKIRVSIVKFGVKILATLLLGPPGTLIAGGVSSIGDVVVDQFNIEQDTFMYDLALGINLNAYDNSKRVYSNVNRGLKNIENHEPPKVAKGNIVKIDEPVVLGVGNFWGVEYKIFPIDVYSEVTLNNTGSFNTTYEVIADYQKPFFEVPIIGYISWTPVTANKRLRINAGSETTSRLYYLKNGEIGDIPPKGTQINFNIFGETDTGIYYIDNGYSVFGTKKIVTSGDLTVSQEEIDNAEILGYPIRTAIKTPIHSIEYALEIWVENPFKTPISVNLSQQIPENITVTNAANGTIEGNDINWHLYLEPNEYRQIVVTFVSNGAPGVTVEKPQTAMDIYDPINDDTVNFQSNSNNFTTRFPVDIFAYPPTNASIGDSIVVPINITNLLTDSTFSGSIILELVNSEGVSVYNSTTVITLAPSETQELELVASPEVDPGVYLIKGTLQGTEASLSIFEEYISIDAGYVLGFVHLQNQYNHNGTEVKLGNYNATALPDGSYLFEGIPIGIYPLNLTHSGYLDYNGEVTVNEGLNTIPQIILANIIPPSFITNLTSIAGETWLNWTWTNPPDLDFNHTEIYLDSVFQTTTSAAFFNATALAPDTEYTISTRTVDNSGNINTTWVNQTAKTEAGIDTTPPSVTNPTATPPSIIADSIHESQLNVTVTDESGIASVTVDLSDIGGSVTQQMDKIAGTDVYTVNITAAVGTASDTYDLPVNATDSYGNSNTSVSIALTVLIPATIDFDPDTLNKKSEGKWVTVYTELPAGYNVTDINVSTMMLNETVPAELQPTEVADYDSDGIPDLMVKFDRQAVIDILPIRDAVTITVTGKLDDGASFEGSDTIRVLNEG